MREIDAASRQYKDKAKTKLERAHSGIVSYVNNQYFGIHKLIFIASSVIIMITVFISLNLLLII